jgi:membrane fusion protein, copper/silver efflux system
VLANPLEHLHPGMFAEVTLYGGPQRDVLLLPSEALIRTGRRSVVIVDEGEGRYRPVTVRTGPERDGQAVLLDGLSEGQRVVVSGQFLIDSEASLLGAYRRLDTAPIPAAPSEREPAAGPQP